MTKEEFIENWIGGTIFPENLNRDLDLLIQQAIASHEAGKWKKYPENKPERDTFYLCSINVFAGMVIEYDYYDDNFHNSRGDIDHYVIAFRKLPAPYQEGGEG